MKRTGNLFERILERDNLRLAYWKALRGKRHRADARAFGERLEENLQRMAERVRDGTFSLGVYHQFTIYDPKQRRITAPCFRERVLHHAIVNLCEPVFERWLIYDSYACRRGKGRVAALERAQQFARGSTFFLKMDIRKYFDSICHDRLQEKLCRLFKDRDLLKLFERILQSYGTADRGLPIGSLTSQHFANFYLGHLDRFVKETLRAKAYVRYMDDFVIFDASSRRLKQWQERVARYLHEELDLELKPGAYINRTGHGMDWLGARIYPTHMALNRRSRRRFRRKLSDLEREFAGGRLGELELQQRGQALLAFANAAGVSSWQFRRSVLQRSPVSSRRPRTG